MLMKAHQRLGHWDEVRRLATAMGKRGVLAEVAATQLRITAQVEALRQHAGDATGLLGAGNIPRTGSMRASPAPRRSCSLRSAIAAARTKSSRLH